MYFSLLIAPTWHIVANKRLESDDDPVGGTMSRNGTQSAFPIEATELSVAFSDEQTVMNIVADAHKQQVP